MNALNMMIFPISILFYRDGNCPYWKCKNNR